MVSKLFTDNVEYELSYYTDGFELRRIFSTRHKPALQLAGMFGK